MKPAASAVLMALAALAACGSSDNSRECRSSDDCNQGGIAGECLPSPESSADWCAYPDPDCESGRRFGVLAGDGLASTCAPVSAADGGAPDASSPDAHVVDADPAAPDGGPADAGASDAAPADAGIDASPYLINGQAADLVLGQADFTSVFNNAGGLSIKSLYKPAAITIAGAHLWVADDDNHRVLQWNALPVSNFAPATRVLGQPTAMSFMDGPTRSILSNYNIVSVPFGAPPALPRVGVCTAGAKVVVPDGKNSRVLVWASPPAANGANADLVLGSSSFTTQGSLQYARRCWSDGEKLAVSYQDGPSDALVSRVAYWTTFPTANNEAPDQIFTTSAITSDGTRLVAHDGNRVRIWNTWPANLNVVPDAVLGQQDLASSACVAIGPSSMCGDGEVLIADGRLFVSDPGRGRVLVFEPIPTASNTLATYVIGVPDFTTNGTGLAASATNLREALGIAVAGGYLWVTSTNRVLAFQLGTP